MPLTGAQYVQRTEEDIVSFLEAELQAEYGENIDLTDSSAFSTFARSIAALDSTELEPAIKEVFDSAYIDSAVGENLEKLVAILGVERRGATNATGTVEFGAGGTVTQNVSITNGLTVTTDEDDPITFDTTELVTMRLRDDFNSGSLSGDYAGDTANFSVVDGTAAGDPSPKEGSHLLKTDGTANVEIVDSAIATSVGKTMDVYMYIPAGGQPYYRFGTGSGNEYRVNLDETGGSHAIEFDDGTVSTLQSTSTTIPTDEWIRVEVAWLPDGDGTIRSRIYTDSGNGNYDSLNSSVSVSDENRAVEGGYGFGAETATSVYFDHVGDRAAEANIRANESGTVGNVGANSVTVAVSPPANVDSITNRYSIGDAERYLTNLQNYQSGLPEETDSELRERAKQSEGSLGDGTVAAILAQLSAVEGVESVTLFENKTNTDNTGTGGLPPKSFEAVVYGTQTDQDVADALFDVQGFTARDYGGANGSAKSATVEASNGQEFTKNWSEPTTVNIDMTLDLVVNDDYVGDDEIRRRVVNYIGGTLPDGSSTLGTGVEEDIYIHQLQDAVVGPDDTGVIGIDESGSSYTPSTTTDSNNLDIIDIGASEVGQTNGNDGSITITTTTV